MRKTIDEILEFNKIKETISSFACSEKAKANIMNYNIIKDDKLLNKKLKEISAIISLNNINKFPSLNSITNIDSVFIRLKNKTNFVIPISIPISIRIILSRNSINN